MRKIVLIVAGAVLLLIVLCVVVLGGGIAAIFQATQPVADASERFMVALRDGNYQQAYDMCTPTLQAELNDASGLEEMLTTSNRKPSTWSFASRNINNDRGEVTGTATFADNTAGTVSIVLLKSGDDWKIDGFNLR
jgi:hypothetical protein